MQPAPPCSDPACWWQTWASGLLPCWDVVRHIICGVYLFIFLPVTLPSEIPNTPPTRWWEGFLVFGNFSFTTPSPGWVSVPYLFCLSFYLLYFVLPPFKDNGLPFWVAGVLRQHSEVVLWHLLSIQMIFWWICGGESDLPVLFLCHLRATPMLYVSIKHLVRDYLLILINYLMVKYSTCFLVIQLLKRLSACNLIWSFYTL